jgi:succinyl-diaminopimelate desuccinylase
MKGGVAVQLRIAAEVTEPTRDITFVFYDCEEVEAERNGLARVGRTRPELLEGDFAVLLEPTNGAVEGGCKGTLRVEVTARGVAAHSARPWNGVNAIHEAATLLGRLTAYDAQTVEVEGLDYHEALSAVGIRGGIAGNVIPDTCVVTVNYRFAPNKTSAEALAHVRELFDGYDVVVTDGELRPRRPQPGPPRPGAGAGAPARRRRGGVAALAGLTGAAPVA